MASDADRLQQLERLENISSYHHDWLLRCHGRLAGGQPFELIVFRGFSSSTSHSTTADADVPLLKAGDQLETIEILKAPLEPGVEHVLQPAMTPEQFWQALAADQSWGADTWSASRFKGFPPV